MEGKIKNTITLPDGRRVVCRIWDNHGASYDRYTVCFKAVRLRDGHLSYPFVSASEDPFSPVGVGLHDESPTHVDGPHLGKRTAFEDLPGPVQTFIVKQFKK